MAKVFISYSRQDGEIASNLHGDLTKAGFQVFLDKESLIGGENWKHRILKEIQEADYFLPLLSTRSLNKRGYFQKELRVAFDVLDEFPISEIFIVPVRLEDCEPQDSRLGNLQWLDLFPYETGLQKLLMAIGGRQSGGFEQRELYSELLQTAHQLYMDATGLREMGNFKLTGQWTQHDYFLQTNEVRSALTRGTHRVMELRDRIDVISSTEVSEAAKKIIAFALKCPVWGMAGAVMDNKKEMESELHKFRDEARPAFLRAIKREMQQGSGTPEPKAFLEIEIDKTSKWAPIPDRNEASVEFYANIEIPEIPPAQEITLGFIAISITEESPPALNKDLLKRIELDETRKYPIIHTRKKVGQIEPFQSVSIGPFELRYRESDYVKYAAAMYLICDSSPPVWYELEYTVPSCQLALISEQVKGVISRLTPKRRPRVRRKIDTSL